MISETVLNCILGLSGPQDHFGCKWLPWGSPVRAPLATPVALPRAFMPISSLRIRVQLCTAAYSYTISDSSPKYQGSPMFPAAKTHNANKHRGEVIISYSLCSGQRVLCGASSESKNFFSFGPSGGGPTLSCERELACSCFASPQYTIPALPSSPSALSSSGGPLLFVTCH